MLRTPLTSLTTNLDLPQVGDGLNDPEEPRPVAAACREASELADLVDDLVDLARHGRGEPTRQERGGRSA